MKHLKRMVHLI